VPKHRGAEKSRIRSGNIRIEAVETRIMAATLCFTIDVFEGGKYKRNLVRNNLKRVPIKVTWKDTCDEVLHDIIIDDAEDRALDMQRIDVTVSSDKNMSDSLHPELNDHLATAIEFCGNLKYVHFRINLCTAKEHEKDCLASEKSQKNAFNILMGGAASSISKRPQQKDGNAPRFTGTI
jgi:hypothetical protein